jgi:hypothetical protein
MNLTIRIDRLPGGRLKGYFEELPGIFYTSSAENSLKERLSRLARALNSPNVRIREVLPDGDVVLELYRKEVEELEDDTKPASFLTLTEAVYLARSPHLREMALA